VPVRALEIVKTSTPAQALAGDTVVYTITVTNIGQVPYAAAMLTDDLTEVLDDAEYNGDAAATTGTVTFADPILSWTGALAPGASATITYSMTVNGPPLTGDGTLTNAVVGPPESNCGPDDPPDPDCTTDVPVRALEIEKTSDPSDEVLPGQTVTFTVTVTNIGQAPYTAGDPAAFDDDLTEVLDDATFNNDAVPSTGTTSYAEPVLSWEGALAPGASATITYSVTVDDPPTGDFVLTNAVVGPGESNCDTGTEEDCTTDVPVRALEIVKIARPIAVLPGGTVTYTVTVTNIGQVPYAAATFTDDLSGVLDDAEYNEDGTADIGTVIFADPSLTWTGALAPGDVATITYSVTVNDPATGDGLLSNAVVGPEDGSSNCDAGADPADPDCSTNVPVRELLIEKSSSVAETAPGDTVTYTIVVTNIGDFPFFGLFPARFDDDLTALLDDAAFNDDAAADAGEVTYTEPILHWESTEPFLPGDTATITYTVTVDSTIHRRVTAR
jgi:uncharacterized repeat protein (TIGR01451 family)